MLKKKHPHVLLSAYDCAPNKGSVSKIGWQWYFRLVQRTQVTLITHIRNREDLIEVGAPLANSKIIFIDTEWFAKPLYHLANKLFPVSEHARTLFMSPDFYLYDWLAVRQLKAQLKTGNAPWDIIHAVTPVSPIAATRLHVLKRPVVLGPWNGGLKNPPEFPEIMRENSAWLYPIRYFGYLIDFLVGSTRHASAILTATKATRKSIPTRYHSRCRFMLENGIDLELFTPAPWPLPPSRTQPLHIIFIGRFQPFKGLPMLFEAIARLKDQLPIKLTIIGEGSLWEKWENQTKKLQINHLINWYGPASHTQIVEQLHAAHVLCLPSVRESGGGVLLEAMACARPVLTIQYGGPAEIVDDSVGCTIPPKGGASAVTTALVNCLSDIFQHPALWRQRGLVGRQRAEHLYGWEVKINEVLALYQELLKNA
ncbi:MAG: glycosyltransferase family 4 protein [Gammaproteobacteria bacterium]|nr:MAG: glycosyltransferase family 4 protein [Gammaproteobacteria bacterium]